MKKIFLTLSSIVLVTTLTGCWPMGGSHGLIHNRENNYLKAKNEPNLKIPANQSITDQNQEYVIPRIPQTTAPKEAISIDPPGSILNPQKKSGS